MASKKVEIVVLPSVVCIYESAAYYHITLGQTQKLKQMEKTEKVSLISSFTVLILLSLKFVVAFLSGSLALKADAIHSLTDFISTLAVFIGLKISKRKSKTFPYGLHKVENLISVAISLFIFWAGYEIIKEVIFASLPEVKKLPLALLTAVLSFVISYLLSIYKIKAGKQTNSPSLLADGHHSRSDAFSSLIVLIGLSGHLIGLKIEKYAAVFIVLFIIKSGYGILIESLKVLLDASLDYQTLSRVRKIIEEEKKVENIKALTGRSSGRYRFIEADLTLKVKDIERAHHIVSSIEQKIKNQVPFIDSIRIHYEPVEKKTLKYAFPLASVEGQISRHFGEAPFFALIEVSRNNNKILKKEIISNPFLPLEKGKGIAMAEDLIKRDIDFLVLQEKFKGKGPQYVLTDSSAEIIITGKATLREILEELGIN